MTEQEVRRYLRQMKEEDSERAFHSFYNLCYDRLFRIACYFVKHEEWAQEIVLDVFMKLWEQRARLPPPKACDDPVAGIWVSHQYAPRRGIWDQFTLNIQRDPANKARLVGTIHNHVWAGGKKDEQAPPCAGGQG